MIPGGVYDSGGYLPTGLSWAWNGTGRPEPVAPAGGAQVVVLQVQGGGGSEFEQFMMTALRKWVKVKGGGNVQRAFGRPGAP